jgi:hypothetical protein
MLKQRLRKAMALAKPPIKSAAEFGRRAGLPDSTAARLSGRTAFAAARSVSRNRSRDRCRWGLALYGAGRPGGRAGARGASGGRELWVDSKAMANGLKLNFRLPDISACRYRNKRYSRLVARFYFFYGVRRRDLLGCC